MTNSRTIKTPRNRGSIPRAVIRKAVRAVKAKRKEGCDDE